MSRVVIGMDCGEVFVLNEGAMYDAIKRRVEAAHDSNEDMIDFMSDRGRIHLNVSGINYILEETE